MALADPQYLRYNGTVYATALTSVNGAQRTYSWTTGNTTTGYGQMMVSHQRTTAGRSRRLARIGHSKVSADPLITGKNLEYSMSVSLIVDVPEKGYSAAEAQLVLEMLSTWLVGGSTSGVTNTPVNAATGVKFLGGES